MTYKGNRELLKGEMVGFLAAGRIAPLSVLPTLDWAQEMADDASKIVVSGFSSKFEKDVLEFLLKGTCGIVVVLARRMYKTIPLGWRQPLEEGRLLIISTSTAPRQTRETALARNTFIAQTCGNLIMPSQPSETSSLYNLSSKARLLT